MLKEMGKIMLKEMERIFNVDFLMSVILPITVFYVLSHFNRVLLGTILAGSLALIAIVFQLTQKREVNIFTVIVALFSIIGLIGTIVFHNPTFYLEYPIPLNLVLGCIFLSSLIIGKPLIQIFAEHRRKDSFPPNLRAHPKYVSAWRILTAGWGLLCISQAVFSLILLHTVSIATYYPINSVFGYGTTILFMLVTFWFPNWYWRDLKIARVQNIAE